MNKQQVDDFIALIAGSYPSFELTKDRVKAWRMMLQDIDIDTATHRLKKHVAVNKFPPSIAEILNPGDTRRRRNQEPDTMSPQYIAQGGYEIYDYRDQN